MDRIGPSASLGEGRRNIERAVAQRPGEDGLNVEPLMLALLVVGGDPLGRLGLDVVDAQHIADRMRAAHASTASVAAFRLILLVSGAACVANKERRRGKLPAILGPHTGWKFRLMDAKGAALVIDQAARPEFGDRKKPRALEIGGLRARSAADGRHVGVERQPRKVVAGQEAFGREIAVGVEIRAAARRASLQQRELLVRLRLLDLRRLCALRRSGRASPICGLPPSAARARPHKAAANDRRLRELSRGSIGRRVRKCFPVRGPRRGCGRQLGIDAVEDAPHRRALPSA